MSLTRSARAYGYWLTAYRRTWRGSVVSSVVTPVLFLAAMGVGLGSLVDAARPSALPGASYLEFVAPGILAASAMQTAAFESTYPVMAAVKWRRTYDAMLATPLDVGDLLAGHLLWVATRVLMGAAIFVTVMTAFGAASFPGSLLAVPAAVLVGVAFTAPIMAFAASRDNDAGFAALFRFGIVPLFLFSGTFFPVTQLPDTVEPIAYVTPLWHGVQLCRGLSVESAELGAGAAAVHVAYLLALAATGWVLARRVYLGRLRR